MHTTNASLADSPLTYETLKRECERLASIAGKIAALASAKDGFRDDHAFDRLKAEFSAVLADVQSLAITR